MNGEWYEGMAVAISILITCVVISIGVYQMVTGQFIADKADAKIEASYPNYSSELEELTQKENYYGVQAINVARTYCSKVFVCVNTTAALPAHPTYYTVSTSIPINKKTDPNSLYTNHNYSLMYVPAETAGNAEDVLILVDKGEVS
jgi:hypothetical protein